MKTSVKTVCLLMTLLLLGICAIAQTLTPLVNFNEGNGANPQAGLVASGSTLFGTTYSGGSSNFGTVFSVNVNGGNFSNLYSFNGAIYNTNTDTYTTTDGANPIGTLVLSSNMLFGTTFAGGSENDGTVFAANTNGGCAIIHSFLGGGYGANPEAGLVLSGNTLYGTTFLGGTAGEGSIFRINTDGTDFTNIYSFTGGTNGSNPEAALVMSGNMLYGTTYGPYFGQSSGYGTVFRVNTAGGSFSNVYSFLGNTDGANPEAGLVLAGSTLYGTAANGGDFFGTVFKVNTNGSGVSSHPFNYDVGANPQAGLLLSGSTLYGTATNGGSSSWGTVFQINTNGTGFTNIYAFTDSTDGATPEAGLVISGTTLYGTTLGDFATDYGTVFALKNVPGLSISLGISLNSNKVTITWSSTAFSLQSSTNVRGVYTNITGATSPYTNTITGKAQFFRLQEQ
jgi:uncharacterized repeat protein (TIGR03803 family)